MKDVTIKFLLQSTDGQEVLFNIPGKYEETSNGCRLLFKEATDYMLDTDVLVNGREIIIKRTGKIMMDMHLIEDITTNVSMQIEHGFDIKMDCHTKYVEIDNNYIYAIYETEIDKEHGITHKLLIAWS